MTDPVLGPAAIGNLTSLVGNAQIPAEGPKALNVILNFASPISQIGVDLSSQVGNPGPQVVMSVIQGVFVDNASGSVDLFMQVLATGQRLHFPAGSQLYMPIFAPATGPQFVFYGEGNASPNIVIPVYFYNMPLPAIAVGASGGGFNFSSGNLLVADQAAEAALAILSSLGGTGGGAGSGIAVDVVGGGSGGGGDYEWHAANGGNSGTLYTPASGKRFEVGSLILTCSPGRALGADNFAFTDGGAFTLQGYVSGPATPPTLTQVAGPVVLFQASSMGFLSTAANNVLGITWNIDPGGSDVICNFSTLVGDHA